MDSNQLIYSLIIAIIAASPGIYAIIQGRKKIIAETDKYEVEADKLRVETSDIIRKGTLELSEQYRAQVEELEKTINRLQVRIDDLQNELKNAYIEIKRLNELLKFANRDKLR